MFLLVEFLGVPGGRQRPGFALSTARRSSQGLCGGYIVTLVLTSTRYDPYTWCLGSNPFRRKWVTDRTAAPNYSISNPCHTSATMSLDLLLSLVCTTWRVFGHQGADFSRWAHWDRYQFVYMFLMLQTVSHKYHRSRFTSRSKITGSDSPRCSNVRNCHFHLRSAAYRRQGGGNIKSRFPAGPRIHQSSVTR